MTKIKRVRMIEDDFLELKHITGVKRGEVKVMKEVKSLAKDGMRFRKMENVLNDVNEIVWGKMLYEKIKKKQKR